MQIYDEGIDKGQVKTYDASEGQNRVNRVGGATKTLVPFFG
jgi:hypothetical protein